VGPGTHVAANSDVPEYSVKTQSNEIAISDDGSNYITGPSAPSGPGYAPSSTPSPPFNPGYSSTPYPPSAFSSASSYPSSPRPFSRPNTPVFVSTPSSIGGIDRNYVTPTIPIFPSGGPSPLSPSGPTGGDVTPDIIYGLLPPKEDIYYTKQYIPPTPSGPAQIHITPPPYSHSTQGHINITPAPQHYHHSGPGHIHITPAPHHSSSGHISISPPSPTPTVFYPTPTYLPTAEEHSQPQSPHPFVPSTQNPALNFQNPNRYPVDAVIKNTGNGWFYGIPPGSAVRAHIQNIDLSQDRALSPSEALRRDEERDSRHHRSPQRRRV
jgi:hypothetical protein